MRADAFTIKTIVGRLAAAALAAALLSVLIGAMVLPLRAWYLSNVDRLQEGSLTLARLKAVVDYGDAQKGSPGASALQAYAADFLAGAEDAIIIAELQTRLRAIVVGRNCELSSARALPPKMIGTQIYLGLRVQVRGDMKEVHQILYQIETATPFLFIERALFRLDERPVAGPSTLRQGAPGLLAELDVYGAKWPGLEKRAEPSRTR